MDVADGKAVVIQLEENRPSLNRELRETLLVVKNFLRTSTKNASRSRT